MDFETCESEFEMNEDSLSALVKNLIFLLFFLPFSFLGKKQNKIFLNMKEGSDSANTSRVEFTFP